MEKAIRKKPFRVEQPESTVHCRINLNKIRATIDGERGSACLNDDGVEFITLELPSRRLPDEVRDGIVDAVGKEFADMALGELYRIGVLAALKEAIE